MARNYRSMGPDKLLRTIREFESGDTTTEAFAKGEIADLPWVRQLAREKGLLGDEPDPTPAPPTPAEPVTAERLKPIKPQLAFDPAAAHEFDPDEPVVDYMRRLLVSVPRDGSWVMEVKLNGWRWQSIIDPDGVRSIGGRNGKQHVTPDQIGEQLQKLPAGTILDGELVTGNRCSDVGRLDMEGQQKYIVFDLLAFDGQPTIGLSWSDRRNLLEMVFEKFALADPVRIVPVNDVDEELLASWIEAGMEGAVCKRKTARYGPGSRRRDGFVKIKPKQTTDAIVTGWVMGKGQSNRDQVGALEVRLLETDADTTVGYDCTVDEARAMVDRRIEVQHWGWESKTGKVSHPGFVRLRPDMESV